MNKRIHPKPMNIRDIAIKFSTEEQCLEYVEQMRWPDGVVRCPICGDRKSTRLNSSHLGISYAVFCLKKKKVQIASHPTFSSLWVRHLSPSRSPTSPRHNPDPQNPKNPPSTPGTLPDSLFF